LLTSPRPGPTSFPYTTLFRSPTPSRHLVQEAEDLVGLTRREHRRRLVEDQDAGGEIELLEDLDLLLLAGRQRADRRLEIDLERHVLQELVQPAMLGRPVDDERKVRARQREVLGHRHARHEREMLVHHPDPVSMRVARASDDALDVIDDHGALIGRVVAHHALDEGTLPGAVLAEQRVKRAGLEGQGDVVESDQRAESLRHSGDREARWGDLGRWRGDAEMWGALETGPSHLETRRRGF